MASEPAREGQQAEYHYSSRHHCALACARCVGAPDPDSDPDPTGVGGNDKPPGLCLRSWCWVISCVCRYPHVLISMSRAELTSEMSGALPGKVVFAMTVRCIQSPYIHDAMCSTA